MLKNDGFTLIELAIVLLIIGLLMSVLMLPFLKRHNFQEIKLNKQLDLIREALYGYALENNRLPCPATNPDSGVESCTGSNQGFIPYLELGVDQFDVYGNPFLYKVDREFTKQIRFDTRPKDSLEVKSANGKTIVGGSNISVEKKGGTLAAIVLSQGANALRNNISPDEIANLNSLKVTIHQNESPPDGQNDDNAIWISYLPLKNFLSRNGRL